GPAAMPLGFLRRTVNSENWPEGVIRPILSAKYSANQRFPSGPVVIPAGPQFGVGIENSVRTVSSTAPASPETQRNRAPDAATTLDLIEEVTARGPARSGRTRP